MIQAFLEPFRYSRKLRAAAIALLSIIVTAAIARQSIDPNTVIAAIVALASAYMGAVAWEDTATAKADGMVKAAAMTAATQASTTTVTTPGASDVQVTAPVDVPPMQTPKPVIGQMGLEQ